MTKGRCEQTSSAALLREWSGVVLKGEWHRGSPENLLFSAETKEMVENLDSGIVVIVPWYLMSLGIICLPQNGKYYWHSLHKIVVRIRLKDKHGLLKCVNWCNGHLVYTWYY